MEKEFVPYDIALKLKKLGFNDECFGYYSNEYNLEFGLPEKYTNKCHGNPKEGTYTRVGLISAPLYQQAFDWFREKYDIYVEISFNQKYENSKFSYIIRSKSSCLHTRDFPYKTYEEAELECLKKLIEIVKNGKQK